MDVLLFRLLALIGLAMLVAIGARRLRLPYTVGLALAGLGLASARLDLGLRLTHDLVFELLLPPLLFEAALNLRWRELRRDLAPVLALSTLGVLLCAALVAGGLIYGLGWPSAPALAFGALIAATDPIAVVAMMRESGVGGRPRLLIEAESLFNDGSAAVLFTLVLTWSGYGEAGAAGATPAAALATLAWIAVGGLAIGAVVGLAAMAIAGRTDDHLVETALTVVAAYGSFLAAERLHASGVLACVAAGMVMGNLGVLAARPGFAALTTRGREFVVAFWEFSAFLANSFVFLLIGSALAGTPFDRLGLGGLALVVALALAGRALAVYPIGLAFLSSRWAIPWAEQHLLWWGGLRGALALALALALPPAMPLREHILVAAFAVVAFSVLVQGLTAPMLLRRLGRGAESGEAAG